MRPLQYAYGLCLIFPIVFAAQLAQLQNFGPNSSNTKMYIYVPDKIASKPPIVVVNHYCGGTAEAEFQKTSYKSLADKYGFIVIYPQSPSSCWDVSSKKALTHNGGGDTTSIANMVTYTLNRYRGDSSRVFVVGESSGAMLTNVLLATNPELFAAGIAYSGVPAGCFASANPSAEAEWNVQCQHGTLSHTPSQWAQIVNDMYPGGYAGVRPKVMFLHGSIDTTLSPANYNETAKQWTGVFGYDISNPESVQRDTPEMGYTVTAWGGEGVEGGKVVGVYAQGVGHSVPYHIDLDLRFFKLGPYDTSSD